MRSFNTLAIALIGLTLVGCGNQSLKESSDSSTDIVKASFNTEGAPTVGFNIPSMHCESCAGSICRALEEVPGVVDVEANAESKTATVAINKEAFDSAAAIEALAEAAFTDAALIATAVETVSDPLVVMEEDSATEPDDDEPADAGEES